MQKALIIDGVAVNVVAAAVLADTFHPDLAAQFVEVPDQVGIGWRLDGDEWTAPPPPPEPAPVEPGAPAPYYLAKVTFERRFSDPAFVALDQLRVTVRNRPGDWATTANAPWPVLKGYVRPLSDYDAADQVNVSDPAMAALLQSLQATQQVFGEDPVEAQAEIARILTPGPLPGEPAQ